MDPSDPFLKVFQALIEINSNPHEAVADLSSSTKSSESFDGIVKQMFIVLLTKPIPIRDLDLPSYQSPTSSGSRGSMNRYNPYQTIMFPLV